MKNEVPRLVATRDACNLLGVSRSTLLRWEEQGKVHPRRLFGGHRRYWLHELRDAIKTEKEAA